MFFYFNKILFNQLNAKPKTKIYKGYITETDGTYAKVVSLQEEIFDDVDYKKFYLSKGSLKKGCCTYCREPEHWNNPRYDKVSNGSLDVPEHWKNFCIYCDSEWVEDALTVEEYIKINL